MDEIYGKLNFKIFVDIPSYPLEFFTFRDFSELHSFLTSAIDGDEWSASHPRPLYPRKKKTGAGYEAGYRPEPLERLWETISCPHRVTNPGRSNQ